MHAEATQEFADQAEGVEQSALLRPCKAFLSSPDSPPCMECFANAARHAWTRALTRMRNEPHKIALRIQTSAAAKNRSRRPSSCGNNRRLQMDGSCERSRRCAFSNVQIVAGH